MNKCPFCGTSIEENQSFCTGCNAKQGYLRLNQVIFGKGMFIVIGLVIPFIIMFYAISAQNELGLAVLFIMVIIVLFTVTKLLIGKKWFSNSQ